MLGSATLLKSDRITQTGAVLKAHSSNTAGQICFDGVLLDSFHSGIAGGILSDAVVDAINACIPVKRLD